MSFWQVAAMPPAPRVLSQREALNRSSKSSMALIEDGQVALRNALADAKAMEHRTADWRILLKDRLSWLKEDKAMLARTWTRFKKHHSSIHGENSFEFILNI